MYFKIKKADDQVVYLSFRINCSKFKTKCGDDGFVKSLRCVSSKAKPECKTCRLTNRAKTRPKLSRNVKK